MEPTPKNFGTIAMNNEQSNEGRVFQLLITHFNANNLGMKSAI
jgi:hypothetical protein